jgi:hypothetical protein
MRYCKKSKPEKCTIGRFFSQTRKPVKATPANASGSSIGSQENAHWPFDDFFCWAKMKQHGPNGK